MAEAVPVDFVLANIVLAIPQDIIISSAFGIAALRGQTASCSEEKSKNESDDEGHLDGEEEETTERMTTFFFGRDPVPFCSCS